MVAASAITALLAFGMPAQGIPGSDVSIVQRAWGIAETVLGENEDSRVYLQIGGITSGAGLTLGPAFRFEGLAGGRLDVHGVALVSNRRYLLAEASVSVPDLGVEGLRPGVFARRRYHPEEDFFGVGRETAFGDRVSYAYDENAAGAFLRFTASSTLALEGRVEYRRPDIGRGHDPVQPSIEARFVEDSAPGLVEQPDFLVSTASFSHEGATPRGRPTSGGRYEFSLSRYADRGQQTFDFTRLDADVRQYVPLVPGRHVLALRAAGSLTGTAGSDRVPFYYLPVLGGTKSLRGYHDFRFHGRHTLLLQGEYRWYPVKFVEAAAFYEAGTVALRVEDIRADDLLTDYGVAIRFGAESRVFLRIESAFGGRDGTRVFMKFSGAF